MNVQSVPRALGDHNAKQVQSGRNLFEIIFRAGLESPYNHGPQQIHTALTQTTASEESKYQSDTNSQALVEKMVQGHRYTLKVDGQRHSQHTNSSDYTPCYQYKESGSSTGEATDNQEDSSYLHKEVRLFRQSLSAWGMSPHCDAGTADSDARCSPSSLPASWLEQGVEWSDPGAQCVQCVPASRNKIRYTTVNKSLPRGGHRSVSSAVGAIHCMGRSENQPHINNQPEVISSVETQTPSCTSDGQQQALSVGVLASPSDANLAFTEEGASPCRSSDEMVQLPESVAFPKPDVNPSTSPCAGDNEVHHFFTTVVVSFLPAFFSVKDLHRQLDVLGLRGTYDFLHFRPEGSTGTACINFIRPMFARLCQDVLQCHLPGSTIEPALVQGYESNVTLLNQLAVTTEIDAGNIFIEPSSQDGSTLVAPRFSPRIRGQFSKTKMCIFHKKNRCVLGSKCSFAHTTAELQPTPNLEKTRLCFNYFRNQCYDPDCKFAHGYAELRATEKVYKTELCRWSTHGWCKAGNSCRYAHTQEEIRSPTQDVEPASRASCIDEPTTVIDKLFGYKTINL